MTEEEKRKRRRIMIISGDESIIDEIKNSKNASLCKSLILETEDDDMEMIYPEVIKQILVLISKDKAYFIDRITIVNQYVRKKRRLVH